MYLLLGVVISIILYTAFMVATENILVLDNLKSRGYIEEIKPSFFLIESSILNYTEVNNIKLPENNWKKTIEESYGYIPSLTFEGEWSYKIDSNNSYICLNTKNNVIIKDAMDKIVSNDSNFTLNNECQITLPPDNIIISYKM